MTSAFGQNLILLEKLAAGGMGEVFRARQIGTEGFQKIVAVKRILPQFAARKDFADLFKAEMNLCAKLQHPNIVQVFSNGREGGYLYLVMEFVLGKTVSQLLVTSRKRGIRIPPQVSCYIVAEAAKGLQYAHTRLDDNGSPLNIIHRDVSPQNIMTGFEGEVKVVDFGIAKAADKIEGTSTGDIKGKVPYAAPEYIEGIGLDSRADIFGLGVVFYELLSQKPLFSGPDTLQTIKNVVEMPIPSLVERYPDVKFEVEGIVMKALERNPDERYQSAEEFYRALSSFMNRAYPQFNQADFAKFIKGLFSAENTPELLELKEVHGLAQRVPTAMAGPALTKPEPLEEEQETTSAESGRSILSSLKVLALPFAVFMIAVATTLFFLKEEPPPSASPSTIHELTAWLVPASPTTLMDLGWLHVAEKPQEKDFASAAFLSEPLAVPALAEIFRETKEGTYVFLTEHNSQRTEPLFSMYAREGRVPVLKLSLGEYAELFLGNEEASRKSSAPLRAKGPSVITLVFSKEEILMYEDSTEVLRTPIPRDLLVSEADRAFIGGGLYRGERESLYSSGILQIVTYGRVLLPSERLKVETFLKRSGE